jgi:hypothetical protein
VSRLLPRPGVGVVVALLLVPTACGSGGGASSSPATDALASAADTTTCLKDAQPVTSTPDGYPASFPLPKGTVLFHVEDRGQDGVIATGVTGIPFDQVLASMNAAMKLGFKETGGETEDADAEANWTGQGFTGRWAIKRSASCPGETVIQLLSKQD